MKLKFDIKKIFKRKVASETLGHLGSPFRKEKDWKILLTSITILMTISCLWSLYLFFGVNSGILFRHIDAPPTEMAIFDKEDLRLKVQEIINVNYEFERLRGL